MREKIKNLNQEKKGDIPSGFFLRSSRNNQAGYLLVSVLVFGSIGVMMLSAVIGWLATSWKVTRQLTNREQALQIAEAGVDYYRWHLAHAKQDFQDGTATSGPYIHQFYNSVGQNIGYYQLSITPPIVGSTIVTLVSRGYVASTSLNRAIEVKFAIPSLAKYAVAANDNMRFGSGTLTVGPIHANGGIHFDGLAENLVTSAKDKYIDPDYWGSYQFGVYTKLAPADPNPPSPVPSRTDVFVSGRQFPVPALDFSGFTADLAQIKTDAQSAGRYFGSSGSGNYGYNLVLKTNNTFDLYKVSSLQSPNKNCDSANQSGWGTWSIKNQIFVANYSFPANGLIFLEDHAWVEGQINQARLTIAVGAFPESSNTYKSITINKDVFYTNYDGRDVLALIAQNNVNVGQLSNNVLEIDASLVAKNGRVGRYYYESACTSSSRSTLNLYGMIATNLRYGFAYTNGTGYSTRNLTYDGNLLYGPPPSFPLTADNYTVISWREIP
ncbi:MAG: hypothetical protein COX02_01185 [Candidatus Vogelbacteria bacterium CG22_combo_CG10-13_8_21_14_all_37_9]|uniref:Uncharacterized protein n=1 Tax=Candidatus Vogelbacteria bacterium CG22_combo_CG10-13_8_21_14_all_37_9 TaxID=1975046 RepID=A0A2H0BKQ9_9BACT|nr:MAG: hypothetical protein COX02_01185 [Candidatus Vogelbacteria bacterium CG22_combo_CG10-13_8_21_14_all_37_9]